MMYQNTDAGKCECGHRGDWHQPMYGQVGDVPMYWPTCPLHRDHATGHPVTADECRRAN